MSLAPSIARREYDGEFQYRAKVITEGRPLCETIFSDWFVDDAAAIAGFTEIMTEQGYEVLEVRIGEITEVVIK